MAILKKLILVSLTTLLALSGSAQDAPPGVEIPPDALAMEPERSFSLSTSFSASTAYVTEGINNLPDSGAFFGDIEAHYEGFTLGVWYVEAFRDAYNEVNIYGDYTLDLDPFEAYLGINSLLYPSGADQNSWEVYAGVSWDPIDWASLFAETY